LWHCCNADGLSATSIGDCDVVFVFVFIRVLVVVDDVCSASRNVRQVKNNIMFVFVVVIVFIVIVAVIGKSGGGNENQG